MTAPKDYNIAMNVQQMAAYGYFNEEFIFYCYAVQREDQIVYKLSESLLNIQTAYHHSSFENLYPTPIHSLLKSTFVPASESITYKTRYKMELIQTMRDSYGPTFFEAMALFQQTAAQDRAFSLLNQYLQEHVLELEYRQLFNGVCQQALEAKMLYPTTYQQLMASADRLYGSLPTISIPLKGRGKLFSGFGYWQPAFACPPSETSRLCYYESATLEETYVRYDQLRRQGIICTPIVQKSYWYTSPNDLKKVKAAYDNFLINLLQEAQVKNLLEQLNTLPPVINSHRYQLLLTLLEEQSATKAVTALIGYGYLFHLLPLSDK